MPDVIVDANIMVSGAGDHANTPPVLVMRGLMAGSFVAIVSPDLIAEYRRVLLRPRLYRVHGMTATRVDEYIQIVEGYARKVTPPPAPLVCPDPTDQHLWDLLAAESEAVLVTGDRKLLESEDFPGRIFSPRAFVERYGL